MKTQIRTNRQRNKYDSKFLKSIVDGMAGSGKKSTNLLQVLKSMGKEKSYGPIFTAMRRRGYIQPSRKRASRPLKYQDAELKQILAKMRGGNNNKPKTLKEYIHTLGKDDQYGSIYQALRRTGMLDKLDITRRPREGSNNHSSSSKPKKPQTPVPAHTLPSRNSGSDELIDKARELKEGADKLLEEAKKLEVQAAGQSQHS